MILVGDIGGTHTRLALFENGNRKVERKYRSQDYLNLNEIVSAFQKEEKVNVTKACFGVAGPITDGVCKTTNLPWIVDADSLRNSSGISSIQLLNDLEAKAYGLDCLDPRDLAPLQTGIARKGNRVLIAAGTGLGEAGLIWDGNKYHPFACEGGHVDFAARNEEEFALFLYLKKKMKHVSYERVISGPGLQLILEFLIETGRAQISEEAKKEMEKQDAPKVISEWGMKEKDAACALALEWFLSLYGSEAGNMALKFLSLNGVYISGGMAPAILEKLKTKTFLSSFADKGRFQALLETIPIWVILNDDVALWGAAEYIRTKE